MNATSSSRVTLLKWLIPYVLVQTFQYQITKNGLTYASPFLLMAIRYLGIGLIFFVIGRKILFDRDALVVAATSSVSTLLWAGGLQYVSTGDSAVLSYTMPLFSIPLAFLIVKEKVSPREVAGAVIGFSGVVVYSTTLSHGSLLFGAVLTVLNAVFWALFSIYYRKLRTRDPVPILTTQFLLGSVPMFAGALFFPEIRLTLNLGLDWLYIIVFSGAIQYFVWNRLFRLARVGKITTLALAVPAATILLDSLLAMRAPPPLALLGAATIFFGIFISSWTRDSR